MKINRTNALRIWEERYGHNQFAKDFHGNLMCKEGFGDPEYFVYNWGQKIYCGWNLHHILPKAHGGTNSKENLICTNIITNRIAADKITFWIDNCLYQVKRIHKTSNHEIYRVNQDLVVTKMGVYW